MRGPDVGTAMGDAPMAETTEGKKRGNEEDGGERKKRREGESASSSMQIDEIIMHVNQEEELEEEDEWAVDDLSGEAIDVKLAKAARAEEIAFMKSIGVYEEVDEKECWKMVQRGPISVRWVDVNKGDDSCPNYRSRLVAREVRQHWE